MILNILCLQIVNYSKAIYIILNLSIFLIYILIIFIYEPLKYKKTFYILSSTSLKIKKGCISHYTIYIPIKFIKYIKIRQRIIQRIFKLYSIVIYTNSGSKIIGNINYQDIKLFKKFLIKRV